jgi:hypothetical protein
MDDSFVYIPVSGKVSYFEAETVCRENPVFVYGQYRKPPKQPKIVSGTWTDRSGYKRLRLHDGTTLSSVSLEAKGLVIYYPIPQTITFPALMVYLDEALSPFKGRRDILISYGTTGSPQFTVEYSTRTALVQAELDLYFYDGALTYQSAIVRPRYNKAEWWD